MSCKKRCRDCIHNCPKDWKDLCQECYLYDRWDNGKKEDAMRVLVEELVHSTMKSWEIIRELKEAIGEDQVRGLLR